MKALKRAAKDTLNGQVQALFVAIVGGGIGLIFLYFSEGIGVAIEEVPYFGAAIVGAIGSLLLLFLWNLAAAPYRIERDGRLEAQKRIIDLERTLGAKKSQRHLTQSQQAGLANAIRNTGIRPGDINVLYFNVSEECANFATDICEAIRSVPIKSEVHNGGFFPHNVKDRGIKLYRANNPELLSLAGQMQDQFEKFGYPTEQREPSDGSKTIYVYVARSTEA